MSALAMNRKAAPSILIAMIFIISSISASMVSFEQTIDLAETNSIFSATNNSQNDAGSGGDAGNNTTNAVTITPGSSAHYIGWADDTTDPQDLYEVVIPTGKLLNATMSFPSNNSTTDFDLYLTDTGLNTLDFSWYANPEGVTTAGTNHSAGGVTVYIGVVAYAGYAQYNLTVHMWTPATANNNQNDAGSGGDAGGAPTNATTLNPGTTSQYSGYGNNNSDILDVYNVSIPTGKNLSASLSHPSGIDFELYLIDSGWTFFIDQSWTNNPETVSTVGTNMSGGGISVYIAVLSSVSAGNYSLTVNIFANSTQTNNPSISTIMNGKNSATVYLDNLTVGSSYTVDYSVYEYPIGQTGSVTNSTVNFSATATNMWDNKSFSHSDVEGDYGIVAILNSGSGSFLDLGYELIYFEMLQANVTNRTAGSFTASNLSSTGSYSMYWEVYDNSTNTTVDSGWKNFSGVSNYYSTLSWTAPSTTNEHILETVMIDSSSNIIGYHEDSFYPPIPSIMISSWTNNANATHNTVDVSMSNLNSGDSYSYQTKISHQTNQTNGTVIASSSMNYFTAINSNQQGQTFSYATPTSSGYYCAVSTLYLSNVSIDSDSACFNFTFDDDNDGVLNGDDLCPNTPAGSTVDQDGCAASQRDSDGDGWMDDVDFMLNDSTQWVDSDGDGYGDNPNGTDGDAFPTDSTQWEDADGDGYGDNQAGVNPDAFPMDSTQWSDADGDGYGDNPNGNGADMFPLDPTQWYDGDGDGYGDNDWGNNGDNFPGDPTQWFDNDNDGYGDNATGNDPDAFPNDGTQWADQDGDGYGDNQAGNNPDKFPSDSSQWSDQDGDGYGDNQQGANPDAFPTDSTQWEDTDGDGYGDNQAGNNPDLFPNDSTQWTDSDSDGYGDNASGINGDQCPFTPLGQSVDENGCSDSQRDSDNDGITDYNDVCPGTFAGQTVDNNGCAETQLDDDMDSVNNTWDLCANTSPSSIADSSGCAPEQLDTDDDGIDDSRDICPTTTAGESVDGNGCSDWEKDDDQDGVSNGKDMCDGTPEGAVPDANGCSPAQKDSDNDGIMDDTDECSPTDPGSVVDSDGCADYQKDTDQDGVNDEGDNCPATVAGSQVDIYGCSPIQKDTDQDGRNDATDECPQTDLGYSVNLDGCAANQRDTDSDGVTDDLDECSFSPTEEIVNPKGCAPTQLDSDNDGVSDAHDDFPLDADETKDSDNDGVGDKEDLFPNDSLKSSAADIENNNWMIYGLIALVLSVAVIMFFMRSKSKDEEDNFEPNFDDMMSEVLPAMSLQAMAGVKEMPPIEEESQQQWVDDNGVNWVKQPDGSMMYFDKTTGQWTPYSN